MCIRDSNGTSNYILCCMDKKNKSFKDVLNDAKKLGYAESNPTADLNGDDVSSKLKILSALCFNSFLMLVISISFDLRSFLFCMYLSTPKDPNIEKKIAKKLGYNLVDHKLELYGSKIKK